jgi:hypothetical protein
MELLNIIFSMGVLFAIYSFIWLFIELGLALLHSGKPKTMFEEYLVKTIKYLFLSDVTFLFCTDSENGELSTYRLLVISLVLLTYFMGKLQKEQNKKLFLSNRHSVYQHNLFDIRAEYILIVGSLLLFTCFIFYPNLASNPISLWFRSTITDIEETAFVGSIFKAIGFFFLIGMILKMLNGVMYLLSGRPFIQASSHFNFSKYRREKDFDDFEEVN